MASSHISIPGSAPKAMPGTSSSLCKAPGPTAEEFPQNSRVCWHPPVPEKHSKAFSS